MTASRRHPFATMNEIEQYLAHATIECLECGQHFKALAHHLRLSHKLNNSDYRQKWGIPASFGLIGTDTKDALSTSTLSRIANGEMTYEHLSRATEAARNSDRWPRVAVTRDIQKSVALSIPRKQLPPGSKRLDGRDADRAREAQRKRRRNK